MGGRGAYSSTYAERYRVPTISIKWSKMPMEEADVSSILDIAVDEGAIVYEKSRESKDLVRDLFAHAALYRDGWEFTVLKERNSKNTPKDEWENYKKSIDIIKANGQYWEIKSPPEGETPGNTRSIERAFSNAIEQFAGHPDAHGGPVRVVFNGLYVNATDKEISQRIVKEMALQGVDEVVQVKKDGTLNHYVNAGGKIRKAP